jgi:hypothetical protein
MSTTLLSARDRIFLLESSFETLLHFCHRKALQVVCRVRKEIPGVNTQGKTLAEVRRNRKDALTLVSETNKDLAARESTAELVREEIVVSV